MSDPVWTPSPHRASASRMRAFTEFASERAHQPISHYTELYQWSIDQPDGFWQSVWDFFDVRCSRHAEKVLRNGTQMPGAKWFEGARLNFAENLLRSQDDRTAIIFCGENDVRRELSFAQLRSEVARVADGLKAEGVAPGDRVAGFLPNCPEAVIAMLASASIGATWSSCSPDFGVSGVLDRFGQIEPKVLFCADGYFYAGKKFDSLGVVREVLAGLGSVRRVVVVPFANADADADACLGQTGNAKMFSAFGDPAAEISFAQLPFDHPLFIMYSSGTTGVPKCIVHGAGGTLLQHLKEHGLHTDVRRDDRLFYFTTCGWMMWNWLVSALAQEAAIVLFDGSPFHPSAAALWEMAERERVSIFGTSAKYISAVEKAGYRPAEHNSLSAIRAILSTGSPLLPENYDFVYRDIKSDVQLASISGGTDIISCFALGNPVLPVYRGELQCRGLGMAVEIFDDAGKPVVEQKGELVCTRPFPSMPVGFWDDDDGKRYHEAYFDRFANTWCHGDYAELTEHGGLIIYGRSDAVLNPGGVRIGTAEIYRQVEKLEEILESIAVGQHWQDDVRVVLFVRLRDGVTLDDALRERIRKTIRANTTPRHVPAKIIAVADIPRTLSGKIVEIAVRKTIHGETVQNTDALANPEALDCFRNLAALAEG
ncbi:MAG: acetoacetate--CoA ligase [Gammaproteobacteria bacterium]|nr:acetoacetate--CoA ligase [Gammaproteobacteria bacterium]